MNAEPVRSERVGPALVLTISREESGNAISREVTAGLEAGVDAARTDHELRALIITGAGDKFFAAGGDLKQYRDIHTREDLAVAFERPRRLMDAIEALPIPVIAAVNGYALGGGAELALAADLRIASTGARIGFPYVKLGLIGGWDGVERLARCCGYGRAMHLLLSGEPVEATRAERLGLVDEVVDGDALGAALALADRFAGYAPLSLRATKRAVQSVFTQPAAQARDEMRALFADLWVSDDHREAEAAFAEKRAPKFEGR